MLSPQALIRGLVQRALPSSINPDGPSNDVAFRQAGYGEMYTQPLVRKSHNLADEGSYFIINNGQTGITPPLATGFVATTPALVIYNNDTLLRRLYLDYINLTALVAVTATSSVVGEANAFFAAVIDNGNRYSSGGTVLTAPVSPNMAYSSSVPNLAVEFGGVTATAATGSARTLVGERVTRPSPTTAALDLVGDTWNLNFGGVEGTMNASQVVTNVNLIPVPMPPAIIGPGQSFLLYLWWANHTPAGGAAGMLPEMGFWMR
jgi:hypothetical protein